MYHIILAWVPPLPGFTSDLLLPLIESQSNTSTPDFVFTEIERGKLPIGHEDNSFVKYEISSEPSDETLIHKLVVIVDEGKFFMAICMATPDNIGVKDALLIELLKNLKTSI